MVHHNRFLLDHVFINVGNPFPFNNDDAGMRHQFSLLALFMKDEIHLFHHVEICGTVKGIECRSLHFLDEGIVAITPEAFHDILLAATSGQRHQSQPGFRVGFNDAIGLQGDDFLKLFLVSTIEVLNVLQVKLFVKVQLDGLADARDGFEGILREQLDERLAVLEEKVRVEELERELAMDDVVLVVSEVVEDGLGSVMLLADLGKAFQFCVDGDFDTLVVEMHRIPQHDDGLGRIFDKTV